MKLFFSSPSGIWHGLKSCPTSNASTSQGRTRSAHEGAPPETTGRRRIASPQQPADGVVGTDWGVSIKRLKSPERGALEVDMGLSKQRLGPSRRNTVLRSGNVLYDGETGRPIPTYIPNFDGSVPRRPGSLPPARGIPSFRHHIISVCRCRAATWIPSCTADVCEAQAKIWVVPWRDAAALPGHDHDAMLLLESQPISPVTTRGWQFQRSGLDLMNVQSLRRRDTMRNGTVHVALASSNLAQSNSTCQLSLRQSDLPSLLLEFIRALLGASQGVFFAADDPVTVSSEHRHWRVRWGPA